MAIRAAFHEGFPNAPAISSYVSPTSTRATMRSRSCSVSRDTFRTGKNSCRQPAKVVDVDQRLHYGASYDRIRRV